MHEGLSLVRLTNRPDMTNDVNRGRKTTTHTNTLFPWGKSTNMSLHSHFPLHGKFFSLVHGLRSDQAKPATGTM